jgi:hypothetical protein
VQGRLNDRIGGHDYIFEYDVERRDDFAQSWCVMLAANRRLNKDRIVRIKAAI